MEEVTEYFLKVVRGEMGLITHIGLHAREPGMKTEDVHRTITLYAQEVLPVLRKEAERIEKQRAQAMSPATRRQASMDRRRTDTVPQCRTLLMCLLPTSAARDLLRPTALRRA